MNVKSVFLAVKYAVPEMKEVGGGVIINTGSSAAVRLRTGGSSAYTTSKGAVNALTRALAMDLAPYNIRVNTINPHMTDTPILGVWSEEQKKAMASTIPIGRMAKPEDIAYAALYLACEESSMVTGVSLNVDGGYGV